MLILRHMVTLSLSCLLFMLLGLGGMTQTVSAPYQTLPSVSKLAEDLSEAVVNISILQTIKGTEGGNAPPLPIMPEGAPFEEFFNDFFSQRNAAIASKLSNLTKRITTTKKIKR